MSNNSALRMNNTNTNSPSEQIGLSNCNRSMLIKLLRLYTSIVVKYNRSNCTPKFSRDLFKMVRRDTIKTDVYM